MKTKTFRFWMLLTVILFRFSATMYAQSNVATLSELIKKGAWVVDVRTPQEFAQGHAKGSVNIPLDQLGSRLTQFKDKKNIVVVCRSGNRSAQAKSILDQSGIKNVYNAGPWTNVNQYIK